MKAFLILTLLLFVGCGGIEEDRVTPASACNSDSEEEECKVENDNIDNKGKK